MLEILQTKNKENYRNNIKKLGLDFDTTFVVDATDGGSSVGFGIYHFGIDEEYNPTVEVDFVQDNSDIMLFDGIIRSILFLAMMKGIDKARFNISQNDKLIKLGFVQNNYNCLDCITKFMSKCKSCKN